MRAKRLFPLLALSIAARRSAASRLRPFAAAPSSRAALLPPRGGASESASAWSAGSKYEYGRTSPRASPAGTSSPATRSVPSSYRDTVRDETEATKEAFAEAFLQRDDRNRFIARVYAILTGQLVFTAGTIQAFHMNPGLRDWMFMHPAGRKVPLLGLLLSTVAFWITMGSEHLRRTSLLKWPLLLVFTVGEAVAVGFISSVYAHGTVIKAMSVTAATTLSVTLYTLLQKNPRYDLSQWGRALAGLSIAFLLYGVIHALSLFGVLPPGFLPHSEAVYGLCGAGLFSLYLAYHTRLIVSGKSAKYQMSEKDYILGAMSLYSDIVNIFLYILRIMGDMDD